MSSVEPQSALNTDDAEYERFFQPDEVQSIKDLIHELSKACISTKLCRCIDPLL